MLIGHGVLLNFLPRIPKIGIYVDSALSQFDIGVSNFMGSDCAIESAAIPVATVKNDPWQIRARRAGLSQTELARLAGRNGNAVSEGLQGKKKGGVPVYLRTIIRLWEISDRQAREAILADPEADHDA